MPVGNDNASALAHLEQRVSYLLERIETSTDPRASNLGRVEDALQDILRHLENQHANLAAIANSSRQQFNAPPPHMDSGIVDMVKRNCPTSASARQKPTAARRTRWKPFTPRSAMLSTASP